MSLLDMGKKLLGDKLGDSGGGLIEAMSGLTDGPGGLDLGALVEKAKASGMGDQVESWLGDGENQPASVDQIKSMFGDDKIADVASKLGVDSNTAAEKLSETVPDLVNQASSGGSLLDKFGGAEGAMNLAKSLFNK